MREGRVLCFLTALVLVAVHGVNGEDPYRFLTWKVTYGDIYPLGVKQQVLELVNFTCSAFATLFLCLAALCKMLSFLVFLVWKQGKVLSLGIFGLGGDRQKCCREY